MQSSTTLSAIGLIRTVAYGARFLALCLPLAASAQVSIGVITQNKQGNDSTGGSGFYLGQSVTTPAGGVWDNIAFNLRSSTTAPYANGFLFLLSQAYTGAPASLSNTTAGFIAKSSSISGGLWYFDPSIKLVGNTQYFFYGATAFDGTNQVLFQNGGNPYAGGTGYQSNGANLNFQDSYDFRFDLSGRALSPPVPEPGSAALMVLGLLGVAAITRRRNSAGSRRLSLRTEQ